MAAMNNRGADVLVRTLEDLGVSRVFTLSGNHIMPIFDALLSSTIEIIHVRQEAASVHMADAWGRLTGELGVALVTGGQGQTNGAAALFTALAAESPVLLLSGHAGISELGQGAFQELAQADIARPMTKASWTIESRERLAADIRKAAALALEGRPGPVHLSLPVDILEEKGPEELQRGPLAKPSRRIPDAALIEAVSRRLAAAERPLVLCGPAMAGERGRGAMQGLQDACGAPVLCMESPRGINDPAHGAFAQLLAEADLLVLVGKPLDFTLRFGRAPAIAPTCEVAVIDPDAALVDRAARAMGTRLVASGVADVGPALASLALAAPTHPAAREAWLERARTALSFEPPDWAEPAHLQGRVHPIQLCRAVDKFLKTHPNGTLICDGGEIGQWPQALIKGERRLINGVSGTIGASIPFAIAARTRYPDAPVVAILGDGTFGFHMAEFDTAVRYGLPFIAVVGNDARWNAEYQIQLRNFGEERARHCELLPTRYDEVVRAIGGYGRLVTDAEELPAALADAHASGLPACINIMIEGVAAPSIRRPEGI